MAESVIKVQGLGKKYIIGHKAIKGYKIFCEQMLQHVHNFYSRTKKLVSGLEVHSELFNYKTNKANNFEISLRSLYT
jgi:hypothetical protein